MDTIQRKYFKKRKKNINNKFQGKKVNARDCTHNLDQTFLITRKCGLTGPLSDLNSHGSNAHSKLDNLT
jgi:hypothetical protein